jgi:hypothetical protein
MRLRVGVVLGKTGGVTSAVPKPGESLADLFPDVAVQWHPTKNGSLTPFDLKAGSSKRVWWKCDKGPDHEWEAAGHSRTTGGSGCRFCAGQAASVTNSLASLFPEIAAEWHPTKNGDLIPSQVTSASNKLVWWTCDKGPDHEWVAAVSGRTGGHGCGFCSGQRTSVTNSLQALFPEIAAQWHPTKNGELAPADVTTKSNKRIWWKCPVADDHEWTAPPSERTLRSNGCPYCSGHRPSVTNRLDTQFPEIATEWHPTENGDLTPADVVAGSAKRVWWKCEVANDHEWQTSVSNRTRFGHGCPCCSGLQASVTNNLETLFPDVAAQWHPTKNGDPTPADVVSGSGKKFWWKCEVANDHEWSTTAEARTRLGQGCPYCSGRKASAAANLETWCADKGDLGKEILRLWHPTSNGALRPSDVRHGARSMFWWLCAAAEDHEWLAPSSRLTSGSLCPFCAGKRVSRTNSLAIQFPEIAAEWHPTENGDLTPADVVAGSGKKAWWKCDAGTDHEWSTTVASRTRGNGCAFCAGQRASTTNSLEALFPEVAAEWHPTKNGDLTSADVPGGSGNSHWWKCDVADDHEWRARVAHRTRTTAPRVGCPACAGKQVSTTNRLDLQFPEIATQWHPTKNGDLTPADVVAGSNTKFWWKCGVADGHEWPAVLASRTGRGSGCPHCTLTPRSAQEMRLAHELSALIDFDLEAHKVRFAGRLRDVDIVFDDLKVVVEFDGAYWHRNKVDKDREKTALMEEAGWQVIRVRERPLDSIHVNDVMVDTLAPAKTVADLVLNKIGEVTGTDVPQLDEYLASEGPWREAQALKAIRAYQAERAAKKAARAKKKS